MTQLKQSLLRTAIPAAVLSMAAVCASAAQVTIKIPVESRWGHTVLAPGKYTVTADPGANQINISGKGKNVSVIVATSDLADAAGNRLEMVNVGGAKFVKEVNLAGLGKKYTLPTPTERSARTLAFTLRDQPGRR